MLRLVLALLLLGGVSVGQSPFDGSWVNKMGERLPEGPIYYSLTRTRDENEPFVKPVIRHISSDRPHF
jgi:hypothetical protein